MKTSLLSVVASVAIPLACAADISLAVRGKDAEYTIVLPEGASESQKYAAEELRDYAARMTGVRLPILTDSAPLPARAVLLGNTRYTEKLLDDATAAKSLGEDGFLLAARPPHLLVVASPVRGTLYGVYDLLERFGGCRWYSSWCEHVPTLESFSVPETLWDEQRPAFLMREPFWYDVLQNPSFAARLRVNSRSWNTTEPKYGGNSFRFGGGLGSCHTFAQLLPMGKYGKDHPEYFAMRDGKRRNTLPPGMSLQYYSQLCLTNPDVLRIVTSNVLERIRKDPGAKFYGVSQNDNRNYCQCPACAAVDAEEGSHAGTVVRFVNAVAEAVEKEFPDVLVETLAYQFSRKPPKKTRLRRNVIPCLCSIECDFARSMPYSPYGQNKSFREDIRGWAKQTDLLYVWDYTTNFRHYPHAFPNVYALQGNIKFFRDNGVKCLFEQGAQLGRHADFAELKAWLIAKWLWNPDLPEQDLLDDFFSGYYGAAAPFARAYFDEAHRLQRAWSADPKRPSRIYLDVTCSALPNEFFERAAGLWAKAAEAVKDDPVRSYNVRMGSFSVDYTRLERLRSDGTGEIDFAFDPKSPRLQDLERAKALASSLLARMDEAKDIRLSEARSINEKTLEAWKKLLNAKLPPSVNGDRLVLEERYLQLKAPGKYGVFADDPLAEDGKAIKLFNTHYEWCTVYRTSKLAFEPGARYTLRARIRVEPKKGAAGEAFWAGVYDDAKNRSCGAITRPSVKKAGEGYKWYDIVTWVPEARQYFWIGPGWYNRKNGESTSVEGVWIDKIEIVKANGQ